MDMKVINQTSMRSCCKDCMYGNGGRYRKANRRHVKRSERQRVMRELRNLS